MPSKIGYQSDRIGQKELVINVSEKCNCYCLNCPNDINFRQREISDNEVFDFIEKNVHADTQRITFIGGEPTIINNLFKIIQRIRTINKNAVIQINSNGRMFAYDGFLQKFLDLNDKNIEFHIALYASNPQLHDKLTMVVGSFDQTVKGAHNLLENNFNVYLRNVVHKLNYKDLGDYGDFIVNEFDKYPNRFKKLTIVGTDLIGNAYNNRKLLAIQHKVLAPYIEQFIDKVNSNGHEVEVHLIPKGIFNEKYRKHVVKSGCVDGAFTTNYGCGLCVYQDECPRLLKSYVEIFGNKDHEPVRGEKKNFKNNESYYVKSLVENNITKEIQESNLSIHEILGILLDLKKVAIIDYLPKEYHKKTIKFFNDHKILYKIQVENNINKVFISKSQYFINKAIRLQYKGGESNNFEDIFELGGLLGYPNCCVRNFISLLKKRHSIYTERQKAFDTMKKPIPYLLNSLTGKYNLINHIPCASDCSQSLEIASEILIMIKRCDEQLYNEYVTALKSPVISWNENQMVTLIGTKKDNLIKYKNVLIRNIQEEDKEKCPYNRGLLSTFNKADEVIIKENSIDLRKNRRMIKSLVYSLYGKPTVIVFS